MLLVGLSRLIEDEMSQSSVFSLIYGEKYKLYTISSTDVNYSLTKQERKRVHAFTKLIAVHLVMIKWSDNDLAIDKNLKDLVVNFLKPIYNVCLSKNARISDAIGWDDDQLFINSVKKELANKHNYRKDLNGSDLLKLMIQLTTHLEYMKIDMKSFDSEIHNLYDYIKSL